MPELRELQKQFSANLFDVSAEQVLHHVTGGAFNAGQLTQIYRNNIITGFTEALRAIYPVVERLVGEGFFLYASNTYINQYPSSSGNLHAYGVEFPSFLGAFEPAQGLKYLPDVAKMEWLYHEVYHERDTPPLDLGALSKIDPKDYGSLGFELNPASRLMHSIFPILDIWRVNQNDYIGDQAVDLESGGTYLLLMRSGEEVEFHPLSETEYGMLIQMRHGCELGACLDIALSINKDFDLNQFLTKYVTNKMLVSFSTT